MALNVSCRSIVHTHGPPLTQIHKIPAKPDFAVCRLSMFVYAAHEAYRCVVQSSFTREPAYPAFYGLLAIYLGPASMALHGSFTWYQRESYTSSCIEGFLVWFLFFARLC